MDLTVRLYHRDPYQTEFQARVLDQRPRPDGTWEVILDRTLFYPTSGGQPHDTGFLDGVRVLEVVEVEAVEADATSSGGSKGVYPGPSGLINSQGPAERSSGTSVVSFSGAAASAAGDSSAKGSSPSLPSASQSSTTPLLVHILEKRCEHSQVTGQIDWERRFDHMQQHTGQHILSGAFYQQLGLETVGFHLGREDVTIDLRTPDLDVPALEAVENLANQIVFANRAVLTHLVGPEELANYPLRKLPVRRDHLRLVEIEDFDYSPCGGTHVRRTGEVGLIKVIGLEKIRKDTRVHFVCGYRALRDYRRKNTWLAELGTRLSVAGPELVKAVERLQANLKEKDLVLAELREKELDREAQDLWAGREELGVKFAASLPGQKFHLVQGVLHQHTPLDLKGLANRLTVRGQNVVVLAAVKEGEPLAHLLVARSPDVPLDANILLREALARMEGRGGGTSTLAQGAGKKDGLPAALELIRARLG